MEKLNLYEFFKSIESEKYCIIKYDNNLFNYISSSDVDIFCYNITSISKILLSIGKKYLNNYEIELKYNNSKTQLYIDFLIDNKIEFRFDLYGEFPSYNKVLIKPALFESTIENRVSRVIKNSDSEFVIYIPNKIDDLIIRYIEYQEWYGLRPDKVKHIDYILNNFADEQEKINFFDKLHHYTQIPKIYDEFDKQGIKPSIKISNFFKLVLHYFKNARGKSLKQIIKKVYEMYLK